LGKQESTILEVLRTRVYAPEEEKIIPFRRLAILVNQNCYRYHDFYKVKKNNNDEAIVAAALYRATIDDKGVVIVSRDKDLERMIRKVTKYVHADNCPAPLLFEALQKGKVSIAHDFNAEKCYKIAYSSVDYQQDHPFHIPERLRTAVEACEAVIQKARAPVISQPKTQILYTSRA